MHSTEARPKAQNRIHKEKMRPAGRILTYMLLDFEMFGRISAEQRVALMLHSLMQSGVDQAFSPVSSPTYNPAKKPYLKLPRKMQLLYHNLPKGWEWGIRGEG